MGSQRRQTLGDAEPRPATINPAIQLFRRRQTTSSDRSGTSYKRGVTGSNPVCANQISPAVMTGLRTEELRALRWNEVDLGARAVAVYRSVLVTGDTKTRKSRRVIGLPQLAVQALHEHTSSKLPAGSRPERCGRITAWSSHRRSGLRHTFVSLLSSDGMPLEDIADLVGHKGTVTTEDVYQEVIVPELRRGAKVMDQLFS
jgi:integrase